ncbi:MAG: 30S ribosomal protein S12 methylthiotransferase RimO, partial [Planctomycetota bacterium]|nr:30S ribosomal protein S12 methylthiotransferase RimO [Planctomycetota bacterium]
WVGRTYGDAPDVDGLVFVTAVSQELHAGRVVEAEIVGTHDYDLIAVS